MRLRRLALAATCALAAGLMIPAPTAMAASSGDNSFACQLQFFERFSPGFSLTPSSGVQDSEKDAGHINCVGKIQGHEVTGPGTFWNQGTYHNSTCLLDHAEGRYFFTVPTTGGPISVEGTFVLDRIGPILSVRSEQPGASGQGSALVLPTKGLCVLSPITEALVFMSVAFQDAD